MRNGSVGDSSSNGESKKATSAREHLSHEWTPSDMTISESLYVHFDEAKMAFYLLKIFIESLFL